MEQNQSAVRVSVCNGVLNAVLAAGKLTVGTLCASQALVSDGIHGLVDVLSAVVVFVGLRVSAKDDNADYPYGRERAECVAALILALLIGVTGGMLAAAGIEALITPPAGEVPYGGAALITALSAMLIKEGMFRVTRRVAKRTGSTALMADAWHQRTDVFSSLAGFVGILGATLGFVRADALASLLISAFILKAAFTIFTDAVRRMTDHAADQALEGTIRTCIRQVPGVLEVDSLKTRLFGSRLYVETTVCVDEQIGSKEAYAIAVDVRKAAECAFSQIKECGVHIHPIAVAKKGSL